MLNRKISDYLFYAVLIIIVGIVFLIRSVTLGSVNDKIAVLEKSNISLQQQNDALELLVEQYKDVQIDHLYELYDRVPNYFSETDLTYYTISQLELIGVTEAVDSQRNVYVETDVNFDSDSIFVDLQDDFLIVKVQVYFTTLDIDVVKEFIDLLYASDQIFIVDNVEYTSPDGFNYIGVIINFLAFYEIPEEVN